eukprot:COSAG03_NODE_3064_length_2252_cov_7.050627_1_plen_87_part_10
MKAVSDVLDIGTRCPNWAIAVSPDCRARAYTHARTRAHTHTHAHRVTQSHTQSHTHRVTHRHSHTQSHTESHTHLGFEKAVQLIHF